YVDFPASLDTIFDFVFIDGRARSFCIEAGWPLLRSGGVLVVHDAQRPAYHPALARLGARPVFLEPFRSGQICLVRKPTGFMTGSAALRGSACSGRGRTGFPLAATGARSPVRRPSSRR